MAIPANTEHHAAIDQAGRDAGAMVREALEALEAEWYDEAILACERALKQDPACAEAVHLLGLVTLDLDQPTRALELLEKAHAMNPDVQEFAEALAAAYARLGKVNDALFYAKVATTLEPHRTIPGLLPERFGTFFGNLNSARPSPYRDRAERQLESGERAEAASSCEKQLELTPGDTASLRILARACLGTGRATRAVSACQAVLHGEESNARDLSVLAQALSAAGRHDEAAACHQAAIDGAPEQAGLHARLLTDLLRRPGIEAAQLALAHRQWQARHAEGIAPRPLSGAPNADPERRLRVAYLSGAFHMNDLMQIFEPVLKAHGGERIEAFCYADGARCDIMTERLMRAAAKWTDITGVDDETVWEILRGDAVDIVVDLSGHNEGGRPLVLARRPAPLAVSWLGYPHPPGVAAIDHFLTDGLAWPEGLGDPATGEGVWRLPRAHFACRLPGPLPPVGPSPAGQAGHLTFGASGDLGRIGPGTALLWARVLRALPGARLLICNRFDQDPACVERCLELFSHFGLRGRVDVVNMADNFSSALDFYQHVDIALSAAPCGTVVEDCRALWMGVPVIALPGGHHAARLAASLLDAAGHPEWLAQGPEEMAETARGLGADLAALADLRGRLRDEVEGSALADVAGFTRCLEDAYRAMWRNWCAQSDNS
jgi:predicted O-linked N-acetylglucosamine transferase (SPINDLY family)